MNGDKALVKKTGEIKDVENKYRVKYITMSFNYKLTDEQNGENPKFYSHHDSNPREEEGINYILSDGKTYHEKDVVIGIDEIRDHKLKDII